MQIVVLTNEGLKKELLAQVSNDIKGVEWVNEPEEMLKYPDADFFIDLLFPDTPERIEMLLRLKPRTVLVNAMLSTHESLPAEFIRINGWNTFLSRPVVEAAGTSEEQKIKSATVFATFNKTIDWTPDVPGFISARVVAMI